MSKENFPSVPIDDITGKGAEDDRQLKTWEEDTHGLKLKVSGESCDQKNLPTVEEEEVGGSCDMQMTGSDGSEDSICH